VKNEFSIKQYRTIKWFSIPVESSRKSVLKNSKEEHKSVKKETLLTFGATNFLWEKNLSKWTTNKPERYTKMIDDNKSVENLRETTEGLGFEDFYNIMVSVKKITEAYTKLNPIVKDESYAEMWLQIAKFTKRPEQDEQKVIEAYKKLYPDTAEITFENLKELTKIGN
jgi:hypothetical protein